MPGLALFRDTLGLTTWLLVGSCLQSLLFWLLPPYVALLVPAALLASRVITSLLIARGLVSNPELEKIRLGRYTAQIPGEDGVVRQKGSEAGVVLFILGARSNHPFGVLGPGFDKVSRFNENMWKELVANREKLGFLGKTSSWIGTDAESSNAFITLSYWKNIESLHAFAHGPAHREGWDWWNKVVKEHPHIGIMHEVYAAPKHHWENVYINFQPTGMGRAKYLNKETATWDSTLLDANVGRWGSMLGRMDRE